MVKTLQQAYAEKQTRRDQVLAEAWTDLFKSGSSNIQKFNTTLDGLKKIATQFGMKNLQAAISNAEKQFETVVTQQTQGQKPDQNKSNVISMATTFVGIMTDFMKTVSTITSQLPSMKNALAQGQDPQQANQPLNALLGQDAGKFTNLINNQFQKSGGGWAQKIGRFLAGGKSQANTQQVLNHFGLDANKIAQDVMGMTAKQFSEFIKTSPNTPPLQLDTASTQSNAGQPQQSQQTQPGTQPQTSQQPAQAQQAQKPTTTQNTVSNRFQQLLSQRNVPRQELETMLKLIQDKLKTTP